MDPQACLTRLCDSILNRDWSDAVAALNEYYQWRVKGGFQPAGGDAAADSYASILADKLGG